MCLNKHVCFWTCEKYYYIFKCLKGSWSWMHSQQLETRPIRIKPELDFSKTKLDPPKQILIVASPLLGFLLATDPSESRAAAAVAMLIHIVGGNWLQWCEPSLQSCVVGAEWWEYLETTGYIHVTLEVNSPFLLRSHFQWSQIGCVYIYIYISFDLKSEVI